MKCASAAVVIWLLAPYIPQPVLSIPIDNGVEGDPEIECGPAAITVNFNTRKAFEGHVYVKGLYSEANCRNSETGRQVAGITLPFETCNVARTRSLNPKGVFVTTTVVVSFHPHFVTKVDRAYRIQCFYMEADKTVSADVAVSDLTTAFHSQAVAMPICRYEILLNGPDGTPVNYAEVGQQVYHKWTCTSETTDTFCMVVHSCFVDDGNGDKVNIINDEGCALDRYVLNNLEYPSDLMAGQEAHVYKYADRSQLFYQCQITITIKEPHKDCPRPQCAEPTGKVTDGSERITSESAGSAGVEMNPEIVAYGAQDYGDNIGRFPMKVAVRKPLIQPPRTAVSRFTRETNWMNASAVGTMDVRTEMSAFDILESGSQDGQLKRQRLTTNEFQDATDLYCLDHTAVNLARIALLLLLTLITLSVIYLFVLRKANKSEKLEP